MIYPIILCGGHGTRLWPLSRRSMPKQFIPLWSERTCFQEAVIRSSGAAFADPVIVTHHDYRFIARQQLDDLGISGTILLEPEGRNSGPAILAAACYLANKDPDALMAVLAADHRIDDHSAFRSAILAGEDAARDGKLVVFGVEPTRPATGYGYIRPGGAISERVNTVDAFVEKPDRARAGDYVRDGYLWNSGNFLMRAETIIAEYERSDASSVAAAASALERATTDLGFVILDQDAYAGAASLSIDYAVMEKTRSAAVVPVSYAWSDVGTWQTLWDLADKSEEGNTTHGAAELVKSRNCYVDSHENMATAVLGMDDAIVVATPDAVLVANRSAADDVRTIVDRMESAGHSQASEHRRIFRPWGWFETLNLSDSYRVKRILVFPGGRLSLQKHAHRSEHWVVVKGAPTVTVNDEEKTMEEGESVYVPLGSVHRLENRGECDVEIIEVQTGTYLGEDDIVRLDDVYGRTGD